MKIDSPHFANFHFANCHFVTSHIPTHYFFKDENDEEAFLTPDQLQAVRTILERTRAERDDTYCESCYLSVHSGGRRSTHRWLGDRMELFLILN